MRVNSRVEGRKGYNRAWPIGAIVTERVHFSPLCVAIKAASDRRCYSISSGGEHGRVRKCIDNTCGVSQQQPQCSVGIAVSRGGPVEEAREEVESIAAVVVRSVSPWRELHSAVARVRIRQIGSDVIKYRQGIERANTEQTAGDIEIEQAQYGQHTGIPGINIGGRVVV